MKFMTVEQLGRALMDLPGDALVACYSGSDEGMDVPNKPKLYSSPAEAAENYYTKGCNLDEIMGELVDCEPGTGQYGRNKDKKFVPYTGPVVVI